MPFINVKTNCAVPKDKEISIKTQLGQAITAIPGKSEAWLMVGIEAEYVLYFKGTDAPCAIAEVGILGNASPDALSALTKGITDVLTGNLSISADRVYIKYTQHPEWGWNGMNL